jgi:dCTP deaminase
VGNVLSNVGILTAIKHNEIEISPFDQDLLGPCSYDLTLGKTYRRVNKTSAMLNLCDFTEEYSVEYGMGLKGEMVVMPGECILAVTEQSLYLGANHAAEVAGKSSLGRLFQAVHVTAGFVDAGFQGYITLEIVNLAPRPVIYTAGQRIGQVIFTKLDSTANPMYNAKGQYSNADSGPIPAKPIKRS